MNDSAPAGTDRVVHAMIGSFALLTDGPESIGEAVVATRAVRNNAATTLSGYRAVRESFLARMEAEMLEAQFVTGHDVPDTVRRLYDEVSATATVTPEVLKSADELLSALQALAA